MTHPLNGQLLAALALPALRKAVGLLACREHDPMTRQETSQGARRQANA